MCIMCRAPRPWVSTLERSEIDQIERRIAGPSFAKARALMDSSVNAETLVGIGEPADEIVALAKNTVPP